MTLVTRQDKQCQREGEDTKAWRVCGISDRSNSASVLFLIKVIWSLCSCIYWLWALEEENLSDSTRRGLVAWRRIFPPMPSPLPDLMLSLSRSNSSPRFLLCAQNEGSNYTPCPCPQPYFIYKEKEKADRRSRRFVPTPKKVSPFLPFFFYYGFSTWIYFLWYVDNREKKNQIMEKEMETILAINLPFFSIYWNRKLAGSWNAVCKCVCVCLWTSLTNERSDIFLISVYIKKALHDFDFHNMKVKQFRIETIIFFRNWPMKMCLSWVWKTALQSSFPSKLAMTFQKQNVDAGNCGEFSDCSC